jgi:hypothetical protein
MFGEIDRSHAASPQLPDDAVFAANKRAWFEVARLDQQRAVRWTTGVVAWPSRLAQRTGLQRVCLDFPRSRTNAPIVKRAEALPAGHCHSQPFARKKKDAPLILMGVDPPVRRLRAFTSVLSVVGQFGFPQDSFGIPIREIMVP